MYEPMYELSEIDNLLGTSNEVSQRAACQSPTLPVRLMRLSFSFQWWSDSSEGLDSLFDPELERSSLYDSFYDDPYDPQPPPVLSEEKLLLDLYPVAPNQPQLER